MIESVNTKEFKEIIKSGVVIANFTAPWCPDCRKIEPIMQAIATKFKDKAKIIKISFDTELELKDELNIRRIPTIIFYKDGLEVGSRLIEPDSETQISNALESIL